MSNAPRIHIKQRWPEGYQAMFQLSKTVSASEIDPKLAELMKIRASQINKCAFCLDMHVTAARKLGETEQRLALLPAYAEAGCYSEAEQAALALTEAMTELPAQGVPDALIARLRQHFDDTQITKLFFTATVINAWNRLMVADQTPFPVEASPVAQQA